MSPHNIGTLGGKDLDWQTLTCSLKKEKAIYREFKLTPLVPLCHLQRARPPHGGWSRPRRGCVAGVPARGSPGVQRAAAWAGEAGLVEECDLRPVTSSTAAQPPAAPLS